MPSPKSRMPFLVKILLCVLCAVFFLRAITLKFPSLTDPTEGRYALTALDMLKNGSYLVPEILRGNLREPYLGKPPLFFWFTSLSIATFGSDEWSVRLPGFLCFILSAILLAVFGRMVRDWVLGINFALIWSSSLLPFFLSGTVSLDPLLTFFVTSLMVIAFGLLRNPEIDKPPAKTFIFKNSILWRVVFWILAGAGVLVKGPVILLYVAWPIVCFCFFSRNLKASISKLGLLYGPLISFLVFVPWFVAAESSNSGFIKYFLFSENFKRFLVKDYGDRYGTGHEYPYGFSLIFLFIGAFPWSFAALAELRALKFGKLKIIKDKLQNDEVLRFSVCWTLGAPLILIFAKQLHPGYLLPTLPAASILILLVLGEQRISVLSNKFLKFLLPLVSVFSMFAIASGLLDMNFEFKILMLSILIAASLMISIPGLNPSIAKSALGASALFCSVILGANEYINQTSSTQAMVECINDNVPGSSALDISLIEVKQYSAYYYAESNKSEIARPIKLEYVDMDDLPRALPAHLVVKGSKLKELKIDPRYRTIARLGPFLWLSNDSKFNSLTCD